MQKQILNYHIVLEKEKIEEEKNKYVYTAYCPTLGLNEFGKSLDEAIERMEKLISFHIKSLTELNLPVPLEKDAPIFPHTKFSFT